MRRIFIKFFQCFIIGVIQLVLLIHLVPIFGNKNKSVKKPVEVDRLDGTVPPVMRELAEAKIITEDVTEQNYSSTCIPQYSCKQPGHSMFEPSMEGLTDSTAFAQQHDIKVGGSWEPSDCKPTARIAVIIPFMDRHQHLRVFLPNIILFLKKQKKSFTIFLVEQVGGGIFNKALVMNSGFIEVTQLDRFDCIIFHDVDMIPVNFCNNYECPQIGVRHLGLSRNLTKPSMACPICLGGASAFKPQYFKQINGFTNLMYGWGGEDDDAFYRAVHQNMPIHRYSVEIGNYVSLPHKDKKNPTMNRVVTSKDHWRYMMYDGLNSVRSKYKVHGIVKRDLYTHITVSIPGGLTDTWQVHPYFLQQRKKIRMLHRITDTVDIIKLIYHRLV